MHKATGQYRAKQGQSSLEYFIIFAVIASVCLISVSTFLPKVRTSSQGLFTNAVNRILLADKRTAIIPPIDPPTGCKLLPCSNFNDCSDALGTCASGYACSGTCDGLVVPESCVPTRRRSCAATLVTCPSETIFMRGYPPPFGEICFNEYSAEKVFVIDIGPNQNAILIESVPHQELYNTYTLTLILPDGQEYSSQAGFKLWGKNTPAPNTSYDYLPEGKGLLKIKADTQVCINLSIGC